MLDIGMEQHLHQQQLANMLNNIFEMLELANGETENIRIAQGKYYLPEDFKGLVKQIKTEIRCQKQ